VGVAAKMQMRTQGSHKGVEAVQEQWEYPIWCRRGRKGVTRESRMDGRTRSSGSDEYADARGSQGSRGGTGAVGIVNMMQTRTQGGHKGVEAVQEQWD
jgi:hypothetical protein